jgi:hypothetical protein
MPTIRERGGQFHVQVRMTGFPARTGSFPTRRLAERWAITIEAEMIEGRHFRSAADVTPSVIVDQLAKLAAEPYTRAKPGAKRSSLDAGETANEFKRKPATIDRYHAVGSHVSTVAHKDSHWIAHKCEACFQLPRRSTLGAGIAR